MAPHYSLKYGQVISIMLRIFQPFGETTVRASIIGCLAHLLGLDLLIQMSFGKDTLWRTQE